MDVGAIKTPVEVIKEGAFGGRYFRDIYSGVTRKWYRKFWKEFDKLKDTDQKYYYSSYYDVKYGDKCGAGLSFLEYKGWINAIDPYGWFQWNFRYWLGRKSSDNERHIYRWKKLLVELKVN